MSGGKSIIVLGMHRSGTSCLAAALRAGLGMTGSTLWSPDNPAGHHEDPEVVRLNEAVLAASGASWKSAPERLSWTDEHAARRDALMATFDARAEWNVIKDPRLPVTWPFWERAFAEAPIVVTVRHPVAVLDSFITRGDVMSQKAALKLWLASSTTLLRVACSLKAPVVEFGPGAAPFGAQLATALTACSSPAWDELRSDFRPELAAAVVDPASMHHADSGWDGRDLPASLIEEAITMHRALLAQRVSVPESPVPERESSAIAKAEGSVWRPRIARALELREQGALSAAAQELERAAFIAPDPAALRRQAVELLLEQGDNDGALAACERALASAAGDPWWQLLRARSLMALGRVGDTVGCLGTLLQAHPEVLPAHLLRIQALVRLQRWGEVLQACRACPASNPQPWAVEGWRSVALLRSGDESAAETAQEIACASAPSPNRAVLRLHWAGALEESGRVEDAESVYRALLHDPAAPLPAYMGLSRVLRKRGAAIAAAEAAEAACRAFPDEAWPHWAAGGIKRMLGEQARARELCERAATLAPEHPETFRQLAEQAKAEGDGGREEAMTHRWALAAQTSLSAWQKLETLARRRGNGALADEARDRARALEAAAPQGSR